MKIEELEVLDPFKYEKRAKRAYRSLQELDVSVEEFEALGF